MIDSKIRIRLESFNHELLNLACDKLLAIVQNINLNSFKVIPMPTHKRIYCVLRSPHVDKDSREHFEIRTHKRLVEIDYDPTVNSNIIDLFAEQNLPSGVYCTLIIGKNSN